MREMWKPNISLACSINFRASGLVSYKSLPIPVNCAPWPGKIYAFIVLGFGLNGRISQMVLIFGSCGNQKIRNRLGNKSGFHVGCWHHAFISNTKPPIPVFGNPIVNKITDDWRNEDEAI